NPVAVTRYPVVHISGALVDEPRMCADSRLGGVFATFTAYVRDHKVDERIVYLNESVDADLGGWAKRHDFLLTAPDFGLIIDRVDVQVCRDFGPMLPAFSCGDLQSYHRRMFVPAE